ncbi:hypothetical protein AOE01nite_22000 [Acetobacter oeni]|uniref:Uncharacterized protein n=1 Tax=Acetobacter oeni TaxID=304077 RepID=A0A511XM22_9PROT|nr:hypothetical protein AA21952_1186 [Acetobacter oeni LMG 21952]GEN63976.1 hypothetical protein AOE01nite_22000 [Acetobacter oeni]
MCERVQLKQDQEAGEEKGDEKKGGVAHTQGARCEGSAGCAGDLPVYVAVPHIVDDASGGSHHDAADPEEGQKAQTFAGRDGAACVWQEDSPGAGKEEEPGADGPVQAGKKSVRAY